MVASPDGHLLVVQTGKESELVGRDLPHISFCGSGKCCGLSLARLEENVLILLKLSVFYGLAHPREPALLPLVKHWLLNEWT